MPFRRLAWLAIAVVTACLCSPAGPAAAAAPTCPGRSQYNSAVDVPSFRTRPVVLVHGWNSDSSSMTDVEMALLASGAATAGRVKPLYFDYRKYATQWAATPQIAACLSEFVGEVSRAYRDKGGDGKVIIVAHSMGGLAIRFATGSQYSAAPLTADEVGGLVTLGTPSLGSPFGGNGVSGSVARILEEFNRKDGTGIFVHRGSGVDGGICLAPHKKPDHRLPAGCAAPPYLPAPYRVSQIAGDATIDRSLLGIHLYDIPLASDGVVPVTSARGYVGSAKGNPPQPGFSEGHTVGCRISYDSVWKAASELGGKSWGDRAEALFFSKLDGGFLSDFAAFDQLRDGRVGIEVADLLGAVNAVAPCAHTRLPHNPEALDDVVSAVAGDLDALGGITLPPVRATQDTATETRRLALTAGVQADPGSSPGCATLSVYGADFPSGDADIAVDWAGAECGGDGAERVFRIRNSRIVETGSACGDCVAGQGDPGERAAVDTLYADYKGVNPAVFVVSPADGTWDLVLESAAPPPGGSPPGGSPPGTTAPGAPPPGTPSAFFETESHNIACTVAEDDGARCDVDQRAWTPPPKPTSCEYDWGPALTVTAHRSGFACVSDSVHNDTVVAYGTVVYRGDFSCDVEQSGVTCTDVATGHGFSVARAAYRLF